jgi:hypothetical protein
MLPLSHWPFGMLIPLDRSVSELRNSVLRRQVPVMLGPPKVSPKAMRTWCSLMGVLGSSAIPLSHMVPTSVPQMPNRV